jgi:hypothetical protein
MPRSSGLGRGARQREGRRTYEADGAADGLTEGATDGAAELELGAADGTAEAGAAEAGAAGEAGGFGATDGATDGTRIGVSLGTAVADGVQAARAPRRETDRAAVAIARFITMTSRTGTRPGPAMDRLQRSRHRQGPQGWCPLEGLQQAGAFESRCCNRVTQPRLRARIVPQPMALRATAPGRSGATTGSRHHRKTATREVLPAADSLAPARWFHRAPPVNRLHRSPTLAVAYAKNLPLSLGPASNALVSRDRELLLGNQRCLAAGRTGRCRHAPCPNRGWAGVGRRAVRHLCSRAMDGKASFIEDQKAAEGQRTAGRGVVRAVMAGILPNSLNLLRLRRCADR